MTGHVTCGAKTLLRFEGLAVLATSVYAYAHFPLHLSAPLSGWSGFAILFLAPDLSMLGYLAGRKAGAAAYNTFHSYLLPLVLLACGFGLSMPVLVSLALIWTAHIGFDRLLGFGLKYAEGFGFTHLGRFGKASHFMNNSETSQ